MAGAGIAGILGIMGHSLGEGQKVLVSAGSSDPWFPVDGVGAVVAGFGPGICDSHLFDGGHGLPAEVVERACSHFADAIS